MTTKPTQNEIDDVEAQCISAEAEGRSKYPAMSYEQGVLAAIRWMQGDEDQSPLED